ncbi:MAG: hypothetical protein QNJ22_10625 [Desulfosarcinaceae bacterium]|nr:hypothetical protein [Desulfosarcinaceae bacterium]
MRTITRIAPLRDILARIINTPSEDLLNHATGEFSDREIETRFLSDTWEDYKKGPQYALLAGGLVVVAFMLTDLLASTSLAAFCALATIRLTMGLLLIGSALSIQRARRYFPAFQMLCLWNQIAVALGLITLGMIRALPFIHTAFHLFMVTLIYYQFLHNRFVYTLIASAFFSIAYCGLNASFYLLEPLDMVRFALYLGLANGLGIPMLRSLNRNRRRSYIQQLKRDHANQQLRATVRQLRQAQKTVKTLEGMLPICSNCKQIRDDNGYWRQIEIYLHQHSQLQFSHSLCPTCARDLYPDFRTIKARS